MNSKDWVALIEAGYSLEGNMDSWLKQVLAQATPLFNGGFWPTIWTYDFTPTTVQIRNATTRGPFNAFKFLANTLKAPSEMIEYVFRSGVQVDSMSEALSRWPEDQRALARRIVAKNSGVLVRDWLGVKALTGQCSGLGMSNHYLKTVTPTTLDRKRWPLAVSHLGAGLRLRALAESLSLDSEPVEGIFDAGGKVYEARDQVMGRTTRETLREAVRRIDRIRTRQGRSDSDAAMEAWEGLVDGRWSLVDHFDTDRRRFVIAIKNDPTYPDPRGLTMRERQVAEFVGLGHSSKEISYTLGVSQSAVTNCTARVQHKLGLNSLAELAAFFAPSGLRAKLAEVAVNGEHLLIGAYPLINEDHVQGLTEAERSVLAHLIAGSTNSDIAQRRNTSEYTVANQVKEIFRKLEVSSRSELAARLQNVA